MTDRKRIDDWQLKIYNIVNFYKKINSSCEKAIEAGVMDPNGEFYETIYESFEGMVHLLDKFGLIFWYLYDNDLGRAGGKIEGKTIKSERDLAEQIVSYENNNKQASAI